MPFREPPGAFTGAAQVEKEQGDGECTSSRLSALRTTPLVRNAGIQRVAPTELPEPGYSFDDERLELVLSIKPKVVSFYLGSPEAWFVGGMARNEWQTFWRVGDRHRPWQVLNTGNAKTISHRPARHMSSNEASALRERVTSARV